MLITISQTILSLRISLICRFSIPIYCLSKILFYSITIIITIAKTKLTNSIALLCQTFKLIKNNRQTFFSPIMPPLCRFIIPLHCLCIIFLYAPSIVITITQITLSIFLTLICSFSIPIYCLSIIFFYSLTMLITNAQIILSRRFSLICRFPVPIYR